VPAPAPLFLDTPRGLVTANGTQYRTNVAQLRAYAGPILDRVGLERLIDLSERTLQAPQTLALVGLPLLLLGLAPAWAALIALSLAALAFVWTPLLAGPSVARAWRVLGLVPVQLVLYLFVLSLLAAQGALTSVAIGLLGFVLLRWGVVTWALDRLLGPLADRLNRLPRPDATLRALIVRTALRSGLPNAQIDAMQRNLIRFLPRR
jgi:hypothetical protein